MKWPIVSRKVFTSCYLRRTKEVMLNFPKPQADGSWKAEKLFTARIPHTVAFNLDGDEMDLYKAVTKYVQDQSARAAESGNERRARAVGFIMAKYQRRMASSTHSLKQSLLRRQNGLKQLLETANQLGELPMPDVPSEQEWEEMDTRSAEQATCKPMRDMDVDALYGEVSQTTAELRDLLEDSDPRYEIFGMNIPASPNPPASVTSLTVTAAGAGRELRYGLTRSARSITASSSSAWAWTRTS